MNAPLLRWEMNTDACADKMFLEAFFLKMNLKRNESFISYLEQNVEGFPKDLFNLYRNPQKNSKTRTTQQKSYTTCQFPLQMKKWDLLKGEGIRYKEVNLKKILPLEDTFLQWYINSSRPNNKCYSTYFFLKRTLKMPEHLFWVNFKEHHLLGIIFNNKVFKIGKRLRGTYKNYK